MIMSSVIYYKASFRKTLPKCILMFVT